MPSAKAQYLSFWCFRRRVGDRRATTNLCLIGKAQIKMATRVISVHLGDYQQPRLGICELRGMGVDVSDQVRFTYRAIYIQSKDVFLKMTDHHLVTLALDTVDALMSPPKQPKVLLFDIGGVCVSCDPSSMRV